MKDVVSWLGVIPVVKNWLRRQAEGLHILATEFGNLPEYNAWAERLRAQMLRDAAIRREFEPEPAKTAPAGLRIRRAVRLVVHQRQASGVIG